MKRRILPANNSFRLLLVSLLWFGAVPAWAMGVPVTLTSVRAVSWQTRLSYPGEIRSVGELSLTAPVTGRVVGPFPPAGHIRKGSIIARVRPAGLTAQLLAGRQEVAYARANLLRNQQLLRDGIISRAMEESSRLRSSQAEDNLRALEAQQSAGRLVAPFSGTIQYLIAPGGVVSAGTPIATLSGRGQPWAEALLPPEQARYLDNAAAVAIQGDGWKGSGTLRNIAERANRSGLLQVMVNLPADCPLLPGEWVTLHFSEKAVHSLAVPEDAVISRGAQEKIFVLHGHTAQAVAVTVLGSQKGLARIAGPIHIGEKVILRNNTRLRDDTQVVVQP
ncbi:efflux RND transporter periplasmic adaptor subunit [Acidithiobacillus sp. AMEEHan]|uniref:efflux RND transporter periplasmic adaptor subunit n=1 Tax=Acidithiobacillus sp. AMEEHan TaxID=2994951 RepID=UPI0027E494AA|nr:efflux RND transporter periplasmic adaptor subunit [Acidithiobacillus sp. AMEEHan]